MKMGSSFMRTGFPFRPAVLTGSLLVAMTAQPAQAVLLDDFSTAQAQVVVTVTGNQDGNVQAVAAVPGGERDICVRKTADVSDPGGTGAVTGVVQAGEYQHSQNTGVSGDSQVTWDGADGSGCTVATNGLGGVDLSVSDAFLLNVTSSDLGGTLRLRVWSNGGGTMSTASQSLPSILSSTTLTFPFSGFTPAINSADIGAIQIEVDGTQRPDLDFRLTDFRTRDVPPPPPPPVPAISALGLLASLIALPLTGLFFAGRRRKS